MAKVLWHPSQEAIKNSNMTKFSDWLGKKTGALFPDYESLHTWSIDNIEDFWELFMEYTEFVYSGSYQKVLDTHKMPGAVWFKEMRLNFAQNIFSKNFTGPAIVYYIENDSHGSDSGNSYQDEYSYGELRTLVARCARGLKEAGIQEGEVVAGYMANVPEAVIACLACASIGAIWSSASPDFGLDALCDRFNQVEPKLIFASTHYRYGGKTFRTDDVLKEMGDRIPSVQRIVSVPYPVEEPNILGDLSWDEFLGTEEAPPLDFAQVDFDHPLYILFSSGTTGVAKCLLHGTGGTLLQHRKELQLHSDIKPGDFLLFFTTCGWMMWNWQVSALSLGATIGLYDGNPGYPHLSAIWRVVNELGVTHFGTSGRFVESCMKSQQPIGPQSMGEMSSLRSILYTGSPLSANGFVWVYDNVKADVHLAGISGGTDIVSCFVLGNPNLPVVAGEIQCKGLGVDVLAYDEGGNPLEGKAGELVCRKPLPSMPVSFLNDPDGTKYHGAYFDVYPGTWCHGDYVQFMASGGVIIYGRSDATLNPGGVRIGSAEIYSALDQIDSVLGVVAVGWNPPNRSDEIIVLFVVLPPDENLDEKIVKTVKGEIREKCSPHHVPHQVFQISQVPITRSGKTVELSVKAVLAGKSVSNRNALANPEVLEEIQSVRDKLLEFYS